MSPQNDRTAKILKCSLSLDGFIAREDGNIDWLSSIPNPDNNDDGYNSFYQQIDTTLMERKTYEQVKSFPCDFPYSDRINYVFSHQKQESNELVHFVNDNIKEFVVRLEEQSGNKNIWLIGGGELNTTFLNAGLIDEIILAIIPVILGKGISLFAHQAMEQQFTHIDMKTFSTGCVQIKYAKK